MAKLTRPYPPAEFTDGLQDFAPAPDLRDWLFANFIAEGGPLENPEHQHLREARIGVLWAAVVNSRHGRRVVGQCEIMPPQGAMGKWQKARALQQISGWFGEVPDFLLTFDAHYAAACDDATFCALCEHEMLHAGQELDVFGAPKFTREGMPRYAMRGHDVETFVSLVGRYGPVEAGVRDLVEAAKRRPLVGQAQLDWACGTCTRAAA